MHLENGKCKISNYFLIKFFYFFLLWTSFHWPFEWKNFASFCLNWFPRAKERKKNMKTQSQKTLELMRNKSFPKKRRWRRRRNLSILISWHIFNSHFVRNVVAIDWKRLLWFIVINKQKMCGVCPWFVLFSIFNICYI